MAQSAVSSALLASTSRRSNTDVLDSTIPFQYAIIAPTTPGVYSSTTSTYTCLETGPYLFSLSAAVPGRLLLLIYAHSCCEAYMLLFYSLIFRYAAFKMHVI